MGIALGVAARPDRPARRRVRPRLRLDGRCRRADRPVPAAAVRPGPQPGRRPTSRSPRSPACSRTRAGRSTTTAAGCVCPTSGSCTGRAATRSTTTRTSTGCGGRSPGPTRSSCTSRSGPATARHADIVLPATTTLERDDVGGGRNDGYVIAMPRAIDPVGEARDDYEIFAELAKRLDVWDEFTEGRTARDWVEHIYERFRERVAARGCGGARRSTSSGRPARRGCRPTRTTTPSSTGSAPTRTRAGCPRRAGASSSSPRPSTGSATTTARAIRRGSNPRSGSAASAPTGSRCTLIANQPSSRLHGQLDAGAHSQASKVAGREPIRIHPDDAAARGIADGDVVRVFNDRGVVPRRRRS